ncbi:protein tyrosine phosphatase [Candidatus Magnetomorum sp. HK-1]|nr:protein tyrosine phosphatase [Candidatus Magnetomorum sp. HK-1]
MGEGVLRYKFDQAGLSHLHLDSAGTSGWDNHKPTSEAIQACSEIGVDISSLRSSPISEQMIQAGDLILAMEKYHVNEMIKSYHAPAEKLFLLGDFHADTPGMEIKDPYGMPISYYRKILKIICQCSDGLIDKIKG